MTDAREVSAVHQESKAGLDLGENGSVIPKPKALMWSQKYTGFQNRRVPLVNPIRFGGEGGIREPTVRLN